MFLQDLNNIPLMPLELQLQLASPLLPQRSSSIVLQRNLDERMNSNGWLFRVNPPLLPGVNVELLHRNLWQQFHEHNTEMIITKSGRRMFPSVQINISGLQKLEIYHVLLEVELASNQRHKYCGYENGNKNNNMGGWSYAGPADPQPSFDHRIYQHPDSPSQGHHWMDNSINFNKLKLTNNVNDKNNVILTSMHKYVPKIWIIRCSNATNYKELFSHPAASFVFKETEFIAVTAYQNDKITKLKIDNNPFAKGFREAGQSRFKRKYQQLDQQSQPRSTRADDEKGSISFSDSESNHVLSEWSSVVSNTENLTHESSKKRAIENTDNDDAGPIAANPLVPIVANPRAALNTENDRNNEVSLHRPWLDSPSPSQMISSSHYNSFLHYQHRSTRYTNNVQNYIRFRDYHQLQFSNYYCPYTWTAFGEHAVSALTTFCPCLHFVNDKMTQRR